MHGTDTNRNSFLGEHRELLGCFFLVVLTVAAYWRVTGHDFIVLDDSVYVYENPHVIQGVNPESITWAFGIADKDDTYWHPVTWFSHMLDCSLFALNPGRHHLTSLLLHLANSLLLFTVLRQMTGAGRRSLLVAGLFALHPLNVESVAWVAERKNVLSTFFWMLTLLAYIRYCRKPGLSSYLVTLLTFCLGLLAKPMLVTLPCVLLLLDYWPLGRTRFAPTGGGHSGIAASPAVGGRQLPLLRLVMEKIPLLALSGGSIALSLLSLQKLGSSVPMGAVPMDLRVANACVSYVAYIGKMFWPVNLAVIYPYPTTMFPAWQIAGAVLLLASLSLFFIFTSRRRPYLIVGWLWFLGTLIPVIGIVQGGLWPAMADRWAYVPLVGLFVILAWGLPDCLAHWKSSSRWLVAPVAVIFALLAATTWKQAGYWQDSVTLFAHTLEVTAPNCAAHDILGVALEKQGRTAEAIEHYLEALRIKPDFEDPLNNLGAALSRQGKTEEAIQYYLRALHLKPDSEKAHLNLGIALEKLGRTAEAVEHYLNALRIKPGFDKAHYNLAVVLEKQGNLDQAIEHYNAALRANPEFEEAYNNLGAAFGKKGQTGKAIELYLQALSRNPDNAQAHYNLGVALAGQGNTEGALKQYLKALQIKPDFEEAHINIATLFFSRGNVDKAQKHLQEAIKINPDNTVARQNLAIVLMNQK